MATLTPTRLEALPFPSSPHVSPSARSTRQDAILSFRRSGSSPALEAPEPVSRTIAVLARSAAKVHCPAILARASAFGLRVLADREERWLPTDVDFLDAFLSAETQEQRTAWMQRLTRSEIRVVVLEGRGAARLWNSLIGRDAELEPANEDDEDEPSQAGLRRTYGDASLYGSATNDAAERQIAYCFPELALPGMLEQLALEDPESSLQPQHDCDEDELNAEPIDEQHMYSDEQQQQQHYDDEGSYEEHAAQEAYSPHLKPQMPSRSSSSDNVFKARPLPESTRAPKVQPRLSKAAALRMGVELPTARRATDEEKSAAASAAAEVGISGLPLTQRERPKSIAAPSMAPRMNRAAAIRAGLDVPVAPRERSAAPAPVSPEIGISGLRRVEGAPPKSIATPSMAPRMNRAAAIRAGIEVAPAPVRRAAPPPAKTQDADVGISGLKKSSVVLPKSLAAPTLAPRANRASAARAGGGVTSPVLTRSNSLASGRTSSISSTASGGGALASAPSVQNAAHAETDAPVPSPYERERKPVDFGTTPGHKRAAASISGMASVKSLQAPSIAPRANRASAARETGGAPMERSRTESASAAVAQKRASVDFSQTPGHNRRNSMTITPKSLAQPSIVPRSNNAAAARRLSIGSATAEAPLRIRPASSAGAGSRPGSAAGFASRPASRGANNAPPPHQDAPPARVRGAAPPSSYRAVY